MRVRIIRDTATSPLARPKTEPKTDYCVVVPGSKHPYENRNARNPS